MADELPNLPMSASGKALARKKGLRSMTNTHAWDRMMNDFTGTNHSKTMAVKDVAVKVGKKESATRQLLSQITESAASFHGSTYHTECGHTSRCRCNCQATRTVNDKCFACTMNLKR